MELAYGIQPFWFWNGEMEEQEIVRQIDEMHSQRIAGFIIHPRQGMTIPYLSDVYFDRVRLAVEQAKKYGMEVWLYDEYPYPSGVTGGEVMLKHPEYQCKELVLTDKTVEGAGEIELDSPWGTVLFANAYPATDGKTQWSHPMNLLPYIGMAYQQEIFQISGLTEYNKKRFFTGGQVQRLRFHAPEGSWRILIVTEKVLDHFKYFGTYIDTMNPAAIRCYLETTHEIYKERLGDDFGNTIKGIFTDEITAFPPEQPWSTLLPEKIKKLHGIDILPWLPAILGVDMGPESRQIRYVYWSSAAKAFMDSYDRQVYAWCEENHLKLIGEKPIMRSAELEFCHIPGFEVGHQKVGSKPNLVPGKYRANGKIAASAAHFYHKPAALCESFHSIGWGMTLQDMKWILDWVALQGTSFYVVHAFFYTTDGLKKHDAPPSAFFQMPWWECMNQLSDYAKKLRDMQQDLKRCVPYLVLDPIASIWSETEDRKDKIKADYQKLQRTMLEHQMDYYIIDPQLLEQSGVVTTEQGPVLSVGGEEYGCIVLPPMGMLEPCCAKTLRQFAELGGKICFVGAVPYELTNGKTLWTENFFSVNLTSIYESYHHGIMPERIKQKGSILVPDIRALLSEEEYILSGYHIETADSKPLEDFITVEYQDTDGSKIYFMVNLTDTPRHVRFRSSRRDCRLIFDGLESRVYREHELIKDQSLDMQDDTGLEISLDEEYSLEYDHLNVMRLNWWDMETEDGQLARVEAMPVIEQLEKGEIRIPVKTRKNFGCIKELDLPKEVYSYHIGFEWKCPIPEAGEEVYLVMEPGTLRGDWRLRFNEVEYSKEDFARQTVYSESNLAVNVSGTLMPGMNHICLRIRGEESFDGIRNPLYLAGRFGVALDGEGQTVTELPKEGCIKDFAKIKIPFYAGSITAAAEIEAKGTETKLRIRDPWLQDTLRISVNDCDLGICSYAPYHYPIPQGVLHQGKNQLKFTMSTTLIGLFEGQYFDREKHAYINYQGEEAAIEDYASIIYK